MPFDRSSQRTKRSPSQNFSQRGRSFSHDKSFGNTKNRSEGSSSRPRRFHDDESASRSSFRRDNEDRRQNDRSDDRRSHTAHEGRPFSNERRFDKKFGDRRRDTSARQETKAGEGDRKIRLPRRKEITADRAPRRPGFTSFQLRLVQSILHTTLVDKRPLDRSYAQWFAKVKIPAVEQGFIIRHINAMFRRLSFYAEVASLKRPSDFERHVGHLILAYCATEGWPLPEINAEGFDRTGVNKRIGAAANHPLLNEGCPYWLEELCSKELKDKWPAERKALGGPAVRFIRTNTLKNSRDELASRLSSEGIVTRQVKGVHTALEVTSNAALFRTVAFHEGCFEQQDAGSQLIAPFLDVKPGQRVIDACAGSGGKTLHLASLMAGKGTLIALDIENWKLDDLKKRARRAGAFNIETRLIDSTKVIKRLYEHADRVLIDAPCSGLGVLRRTADSKWSDLRPRIIELKKVQADILERYSKMAKVGGKVVYSTCSILPSENQEQVKAFLAKHGNEFILEEEKTILPSSGFDGFYMARLQRVSPFTEEDITPTAEDIAAATTETTAEAMTEQNTTVDATEAPEVGSDVENVAETVEAIDNAADKVSE